MDYQDGQRETADGWKDYEDGLAEYEDGKKELDDAKKKLDDASATLAASHYQLTTAQNQLQQLLDQLAQPVGQILAQQGVSLPITSGSELLAAMQDETYGPAVRQAMTQVLSILYQASGMASADELLALAADGPGHRRHHRPVPAALGEPGPGGHGPDAFDLRPGAADPAGGGERGAGAGTGTRSGPQSGSGARPRRRYHRR